MAESGRPLGRIEQTTPLLAGYDTARDWLDKAIRDLARYERNPLSLDGSDAMFDVIVTLNHVRDWVFELHVRGNDRRWPDQQTDRKWREFLFLQCSALEQLADLANAAKHRALQHRARAVDILKEGIIVYELRRPFADQVRRQLETFGRIETGERARIGGGGVMGVIARHRAHLLRFGNGPVDWRYFIDVANEAIRFWDEMIKEVEAETGLSS